MASNGVANRKEENSLDSPMVDALDESPFAPFVQPKMELFDALPTTTATILSKPRFEPKVKPRGQAKVRVSKLAPAPPAPGAYSNPNPNIPLNPAEEEALDHTDESGGSKGQVFAASMNGEMLDIKLEPGLPNLQPKIEEVKVKVEPSPEVGTHAGPEVEMKEARILPEAGQDSNYPAGDRVVREIDVFVSRSVGTDTQFYLLQYPLRPAWRPYGLEEQCQEVRVKAKQKKLEVDLAIDTNGENYDQDAEENLKIKTQTLSSSKMTFTTSYAIGVLQGNKLHLNPLQAVVQLRPSMKYLDEADELKRKQTAEAAVDGDEEMADSEVPEGTAEIVALQVNVRRRETERQEENRLHSHAYLKQLDDAEPWIPLEPHGIDSPVTDGIRRKMIASASTKIPFKMRPAEYINKLVPSQGVTNPSRVLSGDGSGSAGFSRSFLDTLPLEKRFDLVLGKGRVHVLQFERLMKLAPHGCTEQEVLTVLKEKAVLVQGCWVVASSLRYSNPVTIIRDYLLLLFTKNRIVHHSQLKDLRIPKEILREILLSFAVQSGATSSWEFQESTDRSFIKRHQTVFKEQAHRWLEVEGHLRETVMGIELAAPKGPGTPKIDLSTVKEVPSKRVQTGLTKPPLVPERVKGVHFSVTTGDGIGPLTSPKPSGHGSLSEAMLGALPRVLNKVFLKHSVCRLQFICQTLRQMGAVATGAPSNTSSQQLALEEAKAAAQAATAPLPELEAAVSTVASNIDGAYFLSSLGNISLDPFRNVVIALLRAKGPGSGLRKTDITEASKIALGSIAPPAIYQKVLKELCYTKGGAWVMKPGDGHLS